MPVPKAESVMADMIKREDPTPSYLYSVHDVLRSVQIGEFTSLTGGDISVATVSYNLVFEYGGSVTRHYPSHTTYAPVKLRRALDSKCEAIYKSLFDSANGNLSINRTNFSISMLDQEKNEKVIWYLLSAFPIAISGLNFNQDTGNRYTDFEVTIQAEHIEMRFP